MDSIFDPARAERVKKFIGNLTHTKGQWAGQPFELQPWQDEKIITPFFGTIRDDGPTLHDGSHCRQYRIGYVEVPKKNGKTELGAAIALYMLSADGEAAPEVYSAAADKEQAGLVYQVAVQMVRNNPALSKIIKIVDSQKRLVNYRNGGFYRVLSSDVKTKHGINPSCVIFDELHAQPNDELWRVLTSGTDYARLQQAIFVLTTAGEYNKESIWWRTREIARQVQAGIIHDPSFLPVLYIADPETDREDDEELWKKVNPSIGRIFTLDKIRNDYETAKLDSVKLQDFKRYRLNIPIKQIFRWLPMGAWDKCPSHIDEEALLGRICTGGLDLSSTIDLTARALVFPPDDDGADGDEEDDGNGNGNGSGIWIVKVHCYCPEDTILARSKQDKVHYDLWAEQGFITPTPGNCVDYAFIKRDILNDAKKYDIHEFGYDPRMATQFATDLENQEGITMVEVRQGAITMSEPSKDILKKVLTRKLNHGGNPVLRWAADNLVIISDANENIRPAKDKAVDRIDPFVALINAWTRAMLIAGNVYSQRGVMVIE